MSVDGTWDLSISTPIGRIGAVIELLMEEDGLSGTAGGAGEVVPLSEVALNGDLLTWKQAITKPLRLNLAFAVKVDGDTLTGTSKAGRLPASKVTGQRRPSRAGTNTGTDLPDTGAGTGTDGGTDTGTGTGTQVRP